LNLQQEQRDGGWPVWQTDLANPDFAAFAENCGAFGTRIEDADGLAAGLEDALAHEGPALVEILTDSDPV
jgi:thiamine pyrophosphate-dependent acetolactate synthase large subunit-like protein